MHGKARVLVLHGGGPGAWEEDAALSAFVRSLRPEASEVAYPHLTGLELDHTDWPLIQSELAAALDHLEDGGRVVAHSFGGTTLLKFLSEGGPAPRLGGLHLVAVPYMCADGDWSSDAFAVDNDFAAHLPDCGGIWLYHSRDDDIVPVAHVQRYAAKLPHATLHVLDGYGHQFTGAPFNELAMYLADPPAGGP